MIYGYDIETTCKHPFDEGAQVYTVAVHGEDYSKALSVEEDRQEIIDLLVWIDREDNILVGHNILMFDWYWTYVHFLGRLPRAFLFDTQIAYSLLDEDAEENSLNFLSGKILGEHKIDLDVRKITEYPIEQVLEYNLKDTELSCRLFEPLYAKLDERGLLPLYEFIYESGLDLMKAMVKGVSVDVDWINTHAKDLREESEGYESKLKSIIGDDDFNIGSPQQVADLLYNRLGLPVKETTKTGRPSTSFPALNMLKSDPAMTKGIRGFLDLILKYRETEKLLNTYLLPFQDKHRKSDGKIHTSFNIGRSFHWNEKAGTSTGRLSASNPNLQNIPLDSRLRGCLVPSEGRLFCSADYSQVELRVMAWYAQEEVMLEAFRTGKDLHTVTLALLRNTSYEEALEFVETGGEEAERERRVAKTINFLTLYGGSGYRLMKTLFDMGIYKKVKECDQLIETWFNGFPGIRDKINEWEEVIIDQGEIFTPTGRTRHLKGATRDTGKGRHQLRQGVNFMVQSLASDIMLASIPLLDELEGADFLLTVHDSALLEYNPEYFCYGIEKAVRLAMVEAVQHKMKNEFGIEGIPLKVDIKAGLERWQ